MIKPIKKFNLKCNDLASNIVNFFESKMGFIFDGDKVKLSLLCLFLFISSFSLGMTYLNDGMFHYDAIITAEAVETFYDSGVFKGSINGRYGIVILTNLIHYPLHFFYDNADLTVRLTTVLFYALSIMVMFLFVDKLLLNRKIGFVSSLFLMVAPLYISSNTYGKEHGPAIFFLLLSFYLLLLGKELSNKKWLFLSCFSFFFALAIREATILFIPYFFFLMLDPKFSFKDGFTVLFKKRHTLFTSIVFFVMLAVLLKLYLFSAFIRLRSDVLGVAKLQGLFSSIFEFAVSSLVQTTSILWVFVFVGVIISFTRNKQRTFFLILWFMLIFYIGNLGGFKPRYLDVVLIPFFIFASFSLVKFYNLNKILGFVTIFSLLMLTFIPIQPVLEYRTEYNGAKEFALFVNEKTKVGSVIITMDDSPFIRYYGERETMGHPINDVEKTDNFIKDIVNNLSNGKEFYLMDSGLSYDPGGIVKTALVNNFDFEFIGSKLTEDYHNADIKLSVYEQRLFRLHYNESK